MAKLGSAQTSAFAIGTAELRLGPMASAGKLPQSMSVGLLDEAKVAIAQESVELEGGFPRKLVASAIVKQTGTASATLREASRRNLNIILGNGIPDVVTDAATTITADVLIGATTVVTADSSGFTVGDVVVIYQEGKPETVSIVKLTAVNIVDPDGLTFAANSLSIGYLVAEGTIHVYKANSLALGNVTQVNYFAATLIQQGSTGKPVTWNFWKCAIAGNMDYATNATDYASFGLELKILEPTAEDQAAGAPLERVAALIAGHPMGLASL